MRPHTRTQCTDGKECAECSPSGSEGSNQALLSQLGGGLQGLSTAGTISSGSVTFITPTSGPLRRSITKAADAAAAAAAAKATSNAASASHLINRAILIVELPAEILVKTLNYMSFKEISQVRLVSRRFNEICASMLNSTFQRLQSHMLSRFQAIKAQMPRRESARRNHPLARECDIVETLHMRLTLLQMTFGKHIERKHVCFFAGEILDEVQRILRYIRQTPCLQRAYKVTDELFDLSTMAMEYFKEHIEPTLPEISYFGAEFLDFATPFPTPTKRRSQSGNTSVLGFNSSLDSSPCSSRASVAGSSCSEPWSVSSTAGTNDDVVQVGSIGGQDALPQSNMVLRKRIRRIRQGMKRYNDQLVEVKRDLKSCKTKMETQSKQVQEYSSRLEEYDKKFEESSRKFQTLLTELNKCKTELQYWRSKSTTLLSLPPTCVQCEAPLIANDQLKEEQVDDELKALSSMTDGRAEDQPELDEEVQIKATTSKAATVSKAAGPPSPTGGRKRRSRDEPDEENSVTRKSLRGAGVKGNPRGKRLKVSVSNNQ